jgi:hypothetical protein
MKKKLKDVGHTPTAQILGLSGIQNPIGKPKRNKAKIKLQKKSRRKNR